MANTIKSGVRIAAAAAVVALTSAVSFARPTFAAEQDPPGSCYGWPERVRHRQARLLAKGGALTKT
jgi:hypothetical protein